MADYASPKTTDDCVIACVKLVLGGIALFRPQTEADAAGVTLSELLKVKP